MNREKARKELKESEKEEKQTSLICTHSSDERTFYYYAN